MRIHELLSRLPEESIDRIALSDPECEVHNVSFLTREAADSPRSDVLYFCDEELLPLKVPESCQFNCVVIDSSNAGHSLEGLPNINLAYLSKDSDPFSCYNVVQAVFMENQQLTDIVRRLLAAHFSNQGLQYLIEEAANALGNPIVVIDPTYRYVAYHLGDLSQDDTRLAQVMTEEIANETVLEDAVAYIRDSRIDAQIARSKGPYEQHNEMLDCNTMTVAVMVRGVCIAHVMMMEHRHPFGDLDREAFMRLANFVAQELQKSEVWGPTSGELGSYFLENLLSDRSPSVAVTRRRLKSVNFHPKPLLFVVCFHASGEGLTQVQAEHLAAQLRPVLHHSIYTRHHQQLVALISRDEDEGISERTEKKIRDVALLNHLSVGISNAYRDITATRVAYEQARAAIRYGEQASAFIADNSVFRYCHYAPMQVIDLAGRRTNLLGMCHPALMRLMSYDDDHGGELMDTLFCYLEVAGSTARAAKLLNLHKNTMLYRLGRIREVLGMDLSSGEDLYLLQQGFRVLISIGMFSPRLRFTREDLRATE